MSQSFSMEMKLIQQIKKRTKRGSGFSSPRTPVYSFRMHDLIRELEKLERMTNTLLRKVFNSKKTLLKSESKRIPFEEAVTLPLSIND